MTVTRKRDKFKRLFRSDKVIPATSVPAIDLYEKENVSILIYSINFAIIFYINRYYTL